MAPLLEDPRIRQTWNQISQNAETATESAAAGIWSFQHTYINPCFASIAAGFEQCTGHCFPDRDERARRIRETGRTRGRAELSFDFYDDWDEDNGFGNGSALGGGWGNDELDRLLAGSGSHSGRTEGIDQAPRRKRGMSYGTRGRRKSLDPDPTVIPNTNALGFLGRLPFKLGGTLRYKPSAADLQDHPGTMRAEFRGDEGEPLIPDDSDDERPKGKGHTRNRSSTASSGETSDSFRSRGDLFPSDGEDDAVPLSDEFAMVLERRMTDDRSSAKTRSSKGKRPSGSRTVSRNLSRTTQMSPSQTRPTLGAHHASSTSLIPPTPSVIGPGIVEAPSLSDLQAEEERIRHQEELEVEMKRQAAAKLALERGLHPGLLQEAIVESKPDLPMAEDIPATIVADEGQRDVVISETRDNPSSVPVVAEQAPEMGGSSQAPPGASHEEFVPARLPNFR